LEFLRFLIRNDYAKYEMNDTTRTKNGQRWIDLLPSYCYATMPHKADDLSNKCEPKKHRSQTSCASEREQRETE
jgi:hypothetical protein